MRDQPAYREMILSTLEPTQVISILTKQLRIDPAVLIQQRDHGVIRGMAAELLHKYCDISLSQIGKFLGEIDYGAVHLLRRRLRERMAKDAAVREQWKKIEDEVQNACRM